MEAEPAAPEPVQVMAYVLLPAVEIVTASDPEVDVWAVQLAEQAVALVEDQVKLEALLNNTDEVSAESETVAAGGVELPPPQEVIKNIDAASKRLFFIVLIYTHFTNFWSSPVWRVLMSQTLTNPKNSSRLIYSLSSFRLLKFFIWPITTTHI